MSTQRACDICKHYRYRADGRPAVLRYTLRRDARSRDAGRAGTQHTLGSIDICDECWEAIAKPRMSPAKSAIARAAWAKRRAA